MHFELVTLAVAGAALTGPSALESNAASSGALSPLSPLASTLSAGEIRTAPRHAAGGADPLESATLPSHLSTPLRRRAEVVTTIGSCIARVNALAYYSSVYGG